MSSTIEELRNHYQSQLDLIVIISRVGLGYCEKTVEANTATARRLFRDSNHGIHKPSASFRDACHWRKTRCSPLDRHSLAWNRFPATDFCQSDEQVTVMDTRASSIDRKQASIWRSDCGQAISCFEKIKVLNENVDELKQIAQDALEDGLLMGCSEAQLRQAFHEVIDRLINPYSQVNPDRKEA